MKYFPLLLLLSALALAAAPLRAQVPPAAPLTAEGVPALPADWRAAMLADWKTPPTNGTLSATADGVKLVTTVQPPELYNLQARVLNEAPIHKGDTLMIRFAARSLKADLTMGGTKIRVVFAKGSPPWSGSYNGEIGLGSDWERYDIPFTCKNDFAPHEAMLAVTFGYPAQEAEMADLQLLRFSPEVLPGSLPRTKRSTDRIAPEIVEREFARISAMRKELDAVKDPAPRNGKILHVAKDAAPAGDGSEGKPFATIPQALATVKPGDAIQVAAGEYREPRGISIRVSGRPDAWIHIEAAPGARPKIVTSSWSGFEMRGGIAYIEIKGFELEWAPDPSVKGVIHGVGLAPMYASHHLRFLDNVIHHYGTGGICSLDCDYLYLEGNVIYDTAKTSPYGGSGISLCRSFNSDDYAGYHNVVRGNICHDNELLTPVLVSSGGNGHVLTDGNGIIIDVFNKSRANPLKPHGEDKNGPLEPYRHRTLVENNLVYDNGGRGIHVFRSSFVDVVNNTCYMNQKTPDINGGEFTAIQANEVTVLNNIAYGRPDKRGNTQDGSTRVIWSHNLFFNADDVLLHDALIEKDPMFVAAGVDAKPEGFRLSPGSPALGAGVPTVAPPIDLTGAPRPAGGPTDLGAFQSSR